MASEAEGGGEAETAKLVAIGQLSSDPLRSELTELTPKSAPDSQPGI